MNKDKAIDQIMFVVDNKLNIYTKIHSMILNDRTKKNVTKTYHRMEDLFEDDE
jgi:hypothetical protein